MQSEKIRDKKRVQRGEGYGERKPCERRTEKLWKRGKATTETGRRV